MRDVSRSSVGTAERHITTDICVIGAGPAGSVLATRLAQLGHEVCVIERDVFPRPRLGECLSPGVAPLLDSIGVDNVLEAGRFWPLRGVMTKWERQGWERQDRGGAGLLVDRGRFDQLLLEHSRAHGVRVLQPARIRQTFLRENGWHLRVGTGDGEIDLSAAVLADATGRSGALPRRRRRTGPRTLALYRYWTGAAVLREPRIEAGPEAWYWALPLPDGTFNTMMFVDGGLPRASRLTRLIARFDELVATSGLLGGCTNATPVGRLRVTDATPYIDEESVTDRSIKVGDAALALDPLSSSGVQKAVQTALAAAVVINTLRRRSASTRLACEFYRRTLEAASDDHRRWAAAHYAAVARRISNTFWTTRAENADRAVSAPATRSAPPSSELCFRLSAEATFTATPCIDGAFVVPKPALTHPGLARPVAYIGGWELASLLRPLESRRMTGPDLVTTLQQQVPLDDAIRVSAWLIASGILVRETPGSGRA